MTGIETNNGFIDFSDNLVICPNCDTKYDAEKYIKRINKNKVNRTKASCKCKTTFYVSLSFNGDIIIWA